MSAESDLRILIKREIEETGEVPSVLNVTKSFFASLWDEGVVSVQIITVDGKKLYWYEGILLKVFG